MTRGRTKSPARPVHKKAEKALVVAKKEYGTWRAVGSHFGINPGLAWSVAAGETNAPPAVLEALGLLRRKARKRINAQYIDYWPVARLRWAFDNREVMA